MRDLWKSAKSTNFSEIGNFLLHAGNGVHLVECTLKNKYCFILKTCGNVSVRERIRKISIYLVSEHRYALHWNKVGIRH